MGGSSTTTQNNEPYAAAQPMIDQGLAQAQSLYNSGGMTINPYQGDMVADADVFSQAAYGMAPQVTAGNMRSTMAAQDTAGRFMDPNYANSNIDAVTQATLNQIMPSINSSFAGSGMTGSTLHQQNLAEGLSQGLGQVNFQIQRDADQRAMQAAGLSGALNQDMTSSLDYLRGIGSERQMQAQNEINADVMRDQQAQAAELNALQDYMALTTGAGSMFGTSSSTSSQNPGLLGYLGLGAQAAPLMFSDRALKVDVKRVGQTDAGLPIYTYRYATGGAVHMGVMADEAEAIFPDAVETRAGFKAVDYAKLG